MSKTAKDIMTPAEIAHMESTVTLDGYQVDNFWVLRLLATVKQQQNLLEVHRDLTEKTQGQLNDLTTQFSRLLRWGEIAELSLDYETNEEAHMTRAMLRECRETAEKAKR